MKKGISLIVLVVTIIVMIIIAGAIIISLNNTNVIDMGEQAVQKHNEQSIEEAINLAYQDLLIKNLGKISGLEFKEKLEDLSKTYTEIQNITSGNGKVFYSLSITGKEYQLSTSTGKITEYVDQYEKVIGEKSLWVRSGTTIIGFNGTGDELQNVTVPNVLPDENGNEIKITNISLKEIDFQGKLTISNNLIINVASFSDCTSLKEIVIGDGVSIKTVVNATGPFIGCINLEKVTMGKNIKFSGDGGVDVAFANCPKLTTITVDSISGDVINWTFKNVKEALKGEIIINEGAKRIGYGSFWDCTNITSVTIPSTVTEFAGTPFKNCTGLQNVKVNMTEEEFTPFMKSTGLSNDVEIIYLKTATE